MQLIIGIKQHELFKEKILFETNDNLNKTNLSNFTSTGHSARYSQSMWFLNAEKTTILPQVLNRPVLQMILGTPNTYIFAPANN